MAFTTDYDTLPNLVANSTGLATSQYKAVKLASTAGQGILSGALNTTTGPGAVLGVLQNNPGAGEALEFAHAGVVKMVVATSTIAIGDRIGVNSTSQGTDAAVTDNVFYIGRALEASSASGDIITVLLNGGGLRY